MERKKISYWIFQVVGWGFILSMSAVAQYINNQLTTEIAINHVFLFVIGISITHFYRAIIIKLDWLQSSPLQIIFKILIGSMACSILFYGLQSIYVLSFLSDKKDIIERTFLGHILTLINLGIIFFFWSVIYFASHFLEKSRKEEIRGLQLVAARSEMELSNLITQLNPHFMFNAMNGIRALIDENPTRAKDGITKLSNILRNSLIMGKKKLVTVSEEMELVRDYLALELIRYEERLNISYQIDDAVGKCMIPPLMIQIIVENGIKHGISHLTQGGKLTIIIKLIEDQMIVHVGNSGKLLKATNKTRTGIGLKNTEKRLYLIFGDFAKLKMIEDDNMVWVKIVLPLVYKNEE